MFVVHCVKNDPSKVTIQLSRPKKHVPTCFVMREAKIVMWSKKARAHGREILFNKIIKKHRVEEKMKTI